MLFRLCAEGLFSLWGVQIGQADFVLLVIDQQGQGIAVCNFDDFAVIDGLGCCRE